MLTKPPIADSAVVALVNHDVVHRGPGEELQTALLRYLNER